MRNNLTVPFARIDEITFTWRLVDLMNAIMDSSTDIKHMETKYESYSWSFWLDYENIINGVLTEASDEIDHIYDLRQRPMAELPNWFGITA